MLNVLAQIPLNRNSQDDMYYGRYFLTDHFSVTGKLLLSLGISGVMILQSYIQLGRGATEDINKWYFVAFIANAIIGGGSGSLQFANLV
jgi:hypothetical protein